MGFDDTNILVVAISVGVAMLTEAKLSYTGRALAGSPVGLSLDLYHQFPDWFQTIFHSGISAGAVTAIVLNLFLNNGSRTTGDEDLAAHDAPRGARPDPRTIIVTNPSTDVATYDWIKGHGDPQVETICRSWDGVTDGRFSQRGREWTVPPVVVTHQTPVSAAVRAVAASVSRRTSPLSAHRATRRWSARWRLSPVAR